MTQDHDSDLVSVWVSSRFWKFAAFKKHLEAAVIFGDILDPVLSHTERPKRSAH